MSSHLHAVCRREYNRRVKEVVEASWMDAGAAPPQQPPANAPAEKRAAADKPARDRPAKAAKAEPA